MTNGYNIGIEKAYRTYGVYLFPHCKHQSHRKQVGYIDEDGTFRCTDSELMTLEVMEAIVNAWKNHQSSLEK